MAPHQKGEQVSDHPRPYEPKPIDTSNVTLTEDILELTELLAKNAHDIWARQRLAEGWRHGPQRDDARKEHPSLVPYEELSESEKEYDRSVALQIVKSMEVGTTLAERPDPMTDQEFVAYRDGRYAKALEYYDGRAIRNQRWYHFCSVYTLAVSIAVTPVLLGDWPKGHGLILAAMLSPTIALVAGASDHFRFHENWLSYRAAWDALQRELRWHDARVGPYAGIQDRNARFVERAEDLMSHEGGEWLARHAGKDRADSAVARKV